jgi:PLP dependent protein
MIVLNKLNTAVSNLGTTTDNKRLKVFVQVNTSGEESKSGVDPGQECVDLCLHIVRNCPGLELRGLMTIGAPGDVGCFQTLAQCRDQVAAAFREADGVDYQDGPLELSMGMSDDFEKAIAAGATNVRVGSTIFGHRDYSK